jgi:hypothetical protein
MTTRERVRDVDELAASIRRLIEVLIARDQGLIGTHERATDAQRNLRDVLRRAVLGMKAEESAEP